MAYNNRGGDLEALHNIAFPGTHLLTFQLMRQQQPPSNRVNVKNETFYFLTLAPGVGQGSNRTYDFQNKINIKFGNHEIISLSFALHCAAVGNIPAIVGYSKFARSTETKSVSIGIADKQTKFGNQKQITLFISSGKSKYAFVVDSATAEAISKQLEWSAKIATELEFERITRRASFKPNKTQTIQNNQQQPYIGTNLPPVNPQFDNNPTAPVNRSY